MLSSDWTLSLCSHTRSIAWSSHKNTVLHHFLDVCVLFFVGKLIHQQRKHVVCIIVWRRLCQSVFLMHALDDESSSTGYRHWTVSETPCWTVYHESTPLAALLELAFTNEHFSEQMLQQMRTKGGGGVQECQRRYYADHANKPVHSNNSENEDAQRETNLSTTITLKTTPHRKQHSRPKHTTELSTSIKLNES